MSNRSTFLTKQEFIEDMIRKCLEKRVRTELEFFLPTIECELPIWNESNQNDRHFDFKAKDEAENATSFVINSENATIPNMSKVESQLISYSKSSNQNSRGIFEAINGLQSFYEKIKINSNIEQTETSWIEEERRFARLIDNLSTVLGDLVFPYNKFTRRKGALRGSSIYLPGVIKAMSSEWTYKKIFSDKLSGGKRDHAVCFVLDISISMFGSLGRGLITTLIVMMSALTKLNIDKVTIIVFGKEIRLIKTNENSWNAKTIFTLVRELQFKFENDTKDADALEIAIDLLDQVNTKGEKKIFIITDGYTNCGYRLALAQQRAENHAIDIISMAVGIDQTNLKQVYKRYLHCATVFALPKAFRALFEQQNQILESNWTPQKSYDENSDVQNKIETLESFQFNKIFKQMIEELGEERRAMISFSGSPPSTVSVDICFCIDCTGSMSRWLDAVKEQMSLIVDGVSQSINQKYPSLELELAFSIVAYRDVKDKERFEIQPFTKDKTVMLKFIKRLKAKGGDDIPEDVLGALDQCLKLDWRKKNARFIVLMTDAPGHGPQLNADLESDQYPKGVNVPTVEGICDGLVHQEKGVDLMFCRIKRKATEKMEKVFLDAYNSKKEQTDRKFKTIDLFDEKQIESSSIHFIFVLDESGSMEPHWSELEKAYQEFIGRRINDQGGDDHISIIQFSSSARIIHQDKRAKDNISLSSMKGGGTNYCAGLNQAEKVIEHDTSMSSIIMVFMSDGEDLSEKNPVEIITKMKARFQNKHHVICHTVGFGSGIQPGSSAAKRLEEMANTGGGQYYSAKIGENLVNVFGQIAANATTSDALVQRFSEILVKDISMKIVADFF